MRFGRVLALVTVAHVAIGLLAAALGPEGPIPMHWNVHGQPDAMGSRLANSVLFTVMSAVMGGLLVALEGADPRLRAHARTLQRYREITAGTMGFFVLLHGLVAFGAPVGRVIGPLMGLLFAGLGWAIRDVAPNGVMGFRLPWTLASDDAWRKAHRATAWVFGVGGGLTTLLGIWRPEAAFAALMCTVLGGTVVIGALSRRWYHQDSQHKPL
jgi:uncharacterized membrane protein